MLATPLQWAVNLFQLCLPSWPKHPVTPLAADSLHRQKRAIYFYPRISFLGH